MNFILSEMTFLRYFIPIIIEGNKNHINSTLYYYPSRKYNCPLKNLHHLQKLSKEYNFKIDPLNSSSLSGTTFFIEGVGADKVNSDQKVSITYMTDYQLSHVNYWNHIDYCIFPSRSFSQKIHKENDPKSLHLGSPKYDVNLNLSEIKKRYNMANKNVLVLHPKLRDSNQINVNNITNTLRQCGYKVFVKTRGKDPVDPREYPHDTVIHDDAWFPHPSVDLIYACDFLVNFDSTAVKEAAILQTPVINYHIKPLSHGLYARLQFLLKEDFIFHAPTDNLQYLKDTITTIENSNFSEYFNDLMRSKFFNRINVCKNILSLI